MMLLSILTGGVILWAALWILRGYRPFKGVRYLHSDDWPEAVPKAAHVKLLDVRDAADYQERHLPDSINISLGRLPYVWDNDLTAQDTVMILSPSLRSINRAARILHHRGFRQLYAVQLDCSHPACRETKGRERFEHRYDA